MNESFQMAAGAMSPFRMGSQRRRPDMTAGSTAKGTPAGVKINSSLVRHSHGRWVAGGRWAVVDVAFANRDAKVVAGR